MDKTTSYIINNVFDCESLLAERQWQTLRDGVNISPIYEDEALGARAAFLHYIPGASVPTHVHQGFEHIIILYGSQSDGQQTFEAGTLMIHAPGTRHSIHSVHGCLALGIWERPVKFTEDS